jgi:hypothetical protein
MEYHESEVSPVIAKYRKHFNDFDVVDVDNSYIYLRKPEVGAVIASIQRGSLGAYNAKFNVEKFGERSKLFSGNEKKALNRVDEYLGRGWHGERRRHAIAARRRSK